MRGPIPEPLDCESDALITVMTSQSHFFFTVEFWQDITEFDIGEQNLLLTDNLKEIHREQKYSFSIF